MQWKETSQAGKEKDGEDARVYRVSGLVNLKRDRRSCVLLCFCFDETWRIRSMARGGGP